jgi:clan AA aspartic protease (TIGR02281 family)
LAASNTKPQESTPFEIQHMKIIILFIFLGISQTSLSQLTIETQIQNGLYVVPCRVNDVEMDFIFDTGASQVSISMKEALKLIQNGSIEESDILGNSTYMTASGDLKVGTEVILKSIKIKNLELKNIQATVISSSSAPLLLGQNVLSRLGKISLEGNKLTIHNVKNENCDFENLFPFKIGMSTFDISMVVGKDKSILKDSKTSSLNKHELEALNSALMVQENNAEYIPYLKREVNKTVLNFYKTNPSCLNAGEFHYQLYLVDDYLYKINISAEYIEIENALEDYSLLINLVPSEYLFTSKSEISDKYSNVKIGEGITFYKVPREKMNSKKIDEFGLDYKIIYEKYFDKTEKKYRSTATVKNYKLDLQLVNLYNTVLTNEGY